jgi:flagellar FliL protein
MSTAAAATPADAPAPAKGKKKLIIIIAAVAVLLAGGGGAAFVLMKKKAAAEASVEGEEAAAPAAHAKSHDPKLAPTYAPLDPFTVNLADKDAERYAQIGITLELDDPHTADTLKNFMPAVRNNVLMVLAHKTSEELLARDGKVALAREIQRATARALGIELDDEEAAPAESDPPVAKKKAKKKAEPALPVTAVYFSTFIVQ